MRAHLVVRRGARAPTGRGAPAFEPGPSRRGSRSKTQRRGWRRIGPLRYVEPPRSVPKPVPASHLSALLTDTLTLQRVSTASQKPHNFAAFQLLQKLFFCPAAIRPAFAKNNTGRPKQPSELPYIPLIKMPFDHRWLSPASIGGFAGRPRSSTSGSTTPLPCDERVMEGSVITSEAYAERVHRQSSISIVRTGYKAPLRLTRFDGGLRMDVIGGDGCPNLSTTNATTRLGSPTSCGEKP
jgi:hypothetical protein